MGGPFSTVRARGAPAAIVELPTELEITSHDAEEFYGDPKELIGY